jgi:hypothetical protein
MQIQNAGAIPAFFASIPLELEGKSQRFRLTSALHEYVIEDQCPRLWRGWQPPPLAGLEARPAVNLYPVAPGS